MGKIFGNPEQDVKQLVKEKTLFEIKFNTQGSKPWGYYDSEIEHYGHNFDRTVPNNENSKTSFNEYAEKFLKEKQGNAVAIELGGPGSNLFRGFSNGFFIRPWGLRLPTCDPMGRKNRIS